VRDIYLLAIEEKMMGIKWKTDHLRKGDVFRDKEGRELLFIGWWNDRSQETLFGRSAVAVLYRETEYNGILMIPEEDMIRHEHWMGGFMMNEGT